VYLSPPHLGDRELELVREAFASNWIAPLGPQVDAFERELGAAIAVPHVAALSSGTAALHLALRLAGVGPGDRVLCSDLTFAASAFAIRYQGAEPIFIDADRETWQMDPSLLAAELADARQQGKPPKAAIVVDLYGQSADWDPILESCAEHGVTVIEDAAEALGATYRGRPVGGFGRFGASPRPAAAPWSRTTAPPSSRRATWRARRASRFPTTSTRPSGTTTGCPTSWPPSAADRSPSSPIASPRGGAPSRSTAGSSAICPVSPSCRRHPTDGPRGGSPA
jgi:hypothetical protein